LPKRQYIIILMMLCVFTRGLHYSSPPLLPKNLHYLTPLL